MRLRIADALAAESGDRDAYHAAGFTDLVGEYQRDTVNTPVGVRCLKKTRNPSTV